MVLIWKLLRLVMEHMGEVAGDICPAGWSLPIGNRTETDGSFSYLDVVIGGTGSYQETSTASNRWRSFPNNFVYSGEQHGSSVSDLGARGYYWTSTGSSGLYSMVLNFDPNLVVPGVSYRYSYYKYDGYSVRRLALPQ